MRVLDAYHILAALRRDWRGGFVMDLCRDLAASSIDVDVAVPAPAASCIPEGFDSACRLRASRFTGFRGLSSSAPGHSISPGSRPT